MLCCAAAVPPQKRSAHPPNQSEVVSVYPAMSMSPPTLPHRIDAILSKRIGLRLTLWKRLALATAAVTAFVGPLAAGAINRATLSAEQSQGVTPGQPFVDPEARFEVVSIKRFDTSSGTPRASMTPGRFDIAGASLSLLVGQALVTPVDRIFGLPDWANTELYTVTAKAPDDPPPAALALNVMLANLLKDRANLATHRETRQLPVYDLVFARTDKRLGPELKPASPECQAALTARLEAVQRGGPVPPPLVGVNAACNSIRINPGGMVGFNGVPMSRIAQLLTQSVGRPVIDKTGLTGYFDFTLQWTPQPGSEMPIRPAGEPPDRKSTRLNSSHSQISYAVFCLKKKKKKKKTKKKKKERKKKNNNKRVR